MATSIRLKQNSNTNTSTNPRILRWPEVQNKVGMCRSHVHKLVSQGRFPKPIKLGLRSSGWIDLEVNEWLEQRIEISRSSSTEKA